MIDNYDETVNAIKRYIHANAPSGAERDIARLEERSGDYLSLEFRRPTASVSLYIKIDSFAAESTVDEEGNRWRTYRLHVQPSWPSYGSVDLEQASGFLALLSEVVTFARGLAAAFDQPVTKLVETAEQAAERQRKFAEDKARLEVQRLIRANMKGLKVGQERRVEVSHGEPDLLPVGEVVVTSGAPDGSERRYTTHVTSTRTFYVMRTA